MNGIHDMGGMHGFGPIQIEQNEPVFHHAWEGRVAAMTMGTPAPIPGGGRYAIERMDPAGYLAASYYERWLFARILGLIEAGILTREEFEALEQYYRSHPEAEPPQRNDPEVALPLVARVRMRERVELKDDHKRAFGIGDAVRPKNIHPAGHTRLPRYVRGKRGVVTRCYGVQLIQDTLQPGVEAQPEPVYAVRFDGAELWGDSAEPNSAVYIDMWESYLEPA
jgi:nitrile hydratase